MILAMIPPPFWCYTRTFRIRSGSPSSTVKGCALRPNFLRINQFYTVRGVLSEHTLHPMWHSTTPARNSLPVRVLPPPDSCAATVI
mmetsp:Transcript_147496/g.257862  ORF Transcript_147496/g.257862 Transcript_147496/m.257862 type:complete len:86 (-) Transcript_147496:170-427(-)